MTRTINGVKSWGTSLGPGHGKDRDHRVEVLMNDTELERLNTLCLARNANRSELLRMILEKEWNLWL